MILDEDASVVMRLLSTLAMDQDDREEADMMSSIPTQSL